MYELKYQLLLNKRHDISQKYFKDLKAFIECSNDVVFNDTDST